MTPMWLYRPLVNTDDVCEFLARSGVKKMIPPQQLHATLATVRTPVAWEELALEKDEITVPEGHKLIQIFGYTVKALAFGHPRFKERHEQLMANFPAMDHPLLRPHITLYRGGKMPREPYLGKLVFGPEVVQEFDEVAGRNIKHVLVADTL